MSIEKSFDIPSRSNLERSAQLSRGKFSSEAAELLSSKPETNFGVLSNDTNFNFNSFDTTKPLSELTKNGFIRDLSEQHNEKSPPTSDAKVNQVSKMSVGFQNANQDHPKETNFLVKQDGKVELHVNPEKLDSSNITILVERLPGQLEPTEMQKRATDELVKYLSARANKDNPGQSQNIELEDRHDLVSRNVEEQINSRPYSSVRNLPRETQEAVQRVNRMNHSHGVDMPYTATDNLANWKGRTLPHQPHESSKELALKETIAGLFNPDETRPYETIQRRNHGHRVGRYGFGRNHLNSFLQTIGDPPDPEMIEKLVKAGKLPSGFAKKLQDPAFLQRFKQFADKLGDPQANIPTADLKAILPERIQESIASILIDQFKANVGDKPGELAAAFLFGKAPSEITSGDFTSPEMQSLVKAGDRLYKIAEQRQHTESGDKVVGKVPEGERRELISKALEIANVPVTDSNLAAVNLIVQRESAWNPNAINNWDSNARKGVPSQGLMQTIPPTFAAYRDKSLPNNIKDPLANLVAGINYAVKRYGSLQHVPGVKKVAQGLAYVGY